MKSQEELKSEILSIELTSRGISNHFSVSDTDYGVSCYFTFYQNKDSLEKLVIRISDHSVTNTNRLTTERHERADKIDIQRVANAVELYLYPELFVFVPKSEKFTHKLNGIFGIYERK